MRPDVGIVIATADRRPEMLAEELASIEAAIFRVKAKGVRCEVVIEHDTQGRGVAATLAAGLARTDARFTTFWGDDDWMMPTFLERHLEVAAEGFDVVAGSYGYWLGEPDHAPTSAWLLPPARIEDFEADRCTVNDGALVRAATRLPFDVSLGRAWLIGYWAAMLRAGRRFGLVPEPTWLYRRHAGQLSGSWTPEERAMRRQAVSA